MRYFLAVLFLCSVALADPAVIWVNKDVSQSGMDLIMANIKEVGKDKTDIDQSEMPEWFKKSDTNTIGKVVSIRIDEKGVNGWNNLPLAQVETRITKDVSPPDKQNVKVLSESDFKADYEAVSTGGVE